MALLMRMLERLRLQQTVITLRSEAAELPIVADQALLTDLYVRHDWQIAATRPRAAVWVGLTCGQLEMTCGGPGRRRQVTDPVAQWEYVYDATPVASMN
jgi:hypothetical protein